MGSSEYKKLITERFAAWARGDSAPFFDLVADDVRWTVVGTCPGAGTYLSKEEFFSRSVRPVHERLEKSALPEVEDVYADGDTVVVLWKGRTTSKTGKPYDNSYCWVIRLRNGAVVEVRSYLDTLMVAELCRS